MTKKYIYGPGIDNPIVMINVSGTTETWYYYFTDALGSVRLITDHFGVIQESYTYDPFGKPRVMAGAGNDLNWLTRDVFTFHYSLLGNPYMFTARRWDSAANLYYYRFRDYQPDLGRFCQPDPLHYIDGMNLYAYCGNNPLNWLDPWGLSKEWPWWNGFWGSVGDLSVFGTAAHIGYDFGVGVRKGGQLITRGMRKAISLGKRRRRGQINFFYGNQYPNVDPIGGAFRDWAEETRDEALSMPGTSATGPIPTPPKRAAEAIVDGLTGAIGGLNDCPEKQQNDESDEQEDDG